MLKNLGKDSSQFSVNGQHRLGSLGSVRIGSARVDSVRLDSVQLGRLGSVQLSLVQLGESTQLQNRKLPAAIVGASGLGSG